MTGSSISSTRTPQIAPVTSVREGFILALEMKVSMFVRFSRMLASCFWVYPVSQRMISSTSAFVRPFFSALAI
jgi:hypothetical protein